jgi:glycosyltransferase involved in cell wall biosynthesis
VSIVMPAYHEGTNIVPVMERLLEAVTLPFEVLIVVDDEQDTTIPAVQRFTSGRRPSVRTLINDLGPGPAFAIRYGIHRATAPVVVVTMADGSDDPRQIDDLTRLVERGVAVAAASRYMPGGQQVGGPMLKRVLSRNAGRTLHSFARVGTRDATNSFKAYNREFVEAVGIESEDGFEIGLELTAKARRLRLPVAEIPTIWLDREAGVSSFKVAKWVPRYLHWYWFAFGPRLEPDRVNRTRLTSAGPTVPTGVNNK